MNRHLKIMFALAVVLAMVLSACGPKATEAPAEKKTKVAAMFPGVVSDQSWNQFGFEGLKRAEKECGVEIAYSEEVAQDEQIETIRSYAAEGYDIIIGHGGEYEDALATVAEEYPDIRFGVTDGEAKTSNMSGMRLSFRQMGYPAGILACNMTKSNHVAKVWPDSHRNDHPLAGKRQLIACFYDFDGGQGSQPLIRRMKSRLFEVRITSRLETKFPGIITGRWATRCKRSNSRLGGKKWPLT